MKPLCRDCLQPYTPAKPWHVLCIDCYLSTFKIPAIEKLLTHHARSCTYWIFSGDRHCSCGRDKARAELAEIAATMDTLTVHKISPRKANSRKNRQLAGKVQSVDNSPITAKL